MTNSGTPQLAELINQDREFVNDCSMDMLVDF